MIVVGGENLIDMVQVRETGGLPELRAIPGGSQFNCAMALGRLGLDTHYLTPISTDTMGDLLADTITGAGVKLAAPRHDAPSSLAVVTLDGGQPSYQFYREKTAERQVTATSLRATLPADCTVFQVGSLAVANGDDALAWADLFVELAGRGVFCSLDPNVRASFVDDRASYIARLERLIAVSSLVKISDEDLEWLYPGEDQEARCRALLATSQARCLVLTKGSQGAVLFTRADRVAVPAPMLENLADTVGAGDTFMAALVYQFHRMNDVPNAEQLAKVGTFAATAAAINCTRSGCNPPTLDEIQAF